LRGPITPCGLGAGGAVFIRVRTPNLTYTRRHPTDWLISNFLISLIGDIIFISLCLLLWCILHKWYSHAHQPCAPAVDHQPTTKSRIQQACFLFFINNFHPDVKPYYNKFILSDSERTRIEHKRKGHPRHGCQQLVHTSQRDHTPTTHKWMYYPHTSIEILFEILLND